MAHTVYVYCAICIFVGLGFGAVTHWFTSTYAPVLPYTVCIFFFAAVIGATIDHAQQDFGSVFVDNSHFESDMLLYGFLPVLIFGETMNLNWHHVLSGLIQSTWLAGPGAVIGTVLMGVVAKIAIPSWSWIISMMFGAILSATDPVAVVSLLKTSGASHQLTLLIVGESLLNDGSAMVLFTMFFKIAEGHQPTAGAIITFFIETAFCSCLLGMFIGIATNRIMRRLDHPTRHTDMTLQACVTLIAAYFSFFIAQYYLKISGVLCSSAAGLMLAWLAPPVILHHETMHAVWSVMEWSCNTLIFFVAGLVAGNRLYENFTPSDLYYIPMLYFFLMLIRAIVLLMLFPIISRGGLRCTVKDAVFMTWGGLRGALGIALALDVERSGVIGNDRQNARFFVYVAGIAAMTLLINATLATPMLRLLKLVEVGTDSKEKQMVLDHIRRNLRKRITHVVDGELQKELGNYDPDRLKVLCRLLQDETVNVPLPAERGSLNERHSIMASNLVAEQRLSGYRDNSGCRNGINTDILAYVRSAYLSTLRVRYHHYIESGKIGRASWAAQSLLNSIDVAMDHVHSPKLGLHDWRCLEDTMILNSDFEYIIRGVDQILNFFYLKIDLYDFIIARRERREIYILNNFIDGHEYAQRKIRTFLGGEEGDEFVIPEEEQVKWESSIQVDLARERLNCMSAEDMKQFCSHTAARIVLIRQAHLIEEMVHEGALSQQDSLKFLDIIEEDQIRVNKDREDLNKAFVRSRRHRDKLRASLPVRASAFEMSSSCSPSIDNDAKDNQSSARHSPSTLGASEDTENVLHLPR